MKLSPDYLFIRSWPECVEVIERETGRTVFLPMDEEPEWEDVYPSVYPNPPEPGRDTILAERTERKARK